jgi:phage-related minor tail protein
MITQLNTNIPQNNSTNTNDFNRITHNAASNMARFTLQTTTTIAITIIGIVAIATPIQLVLEILKTTPLESKIESDPSRTPIKHAFKQFIAQSVVHDINLTDIFISNLAILHEKIEDSFKIIKA